LFVTKMTGTRPGLGVAEGVAVADAVAVVVTVAVAVVVAVAVAVAVTVAVAVSVAVTVGVAVAVGVPVAVGVVVAVGVAVAVGVGVARSDVVPARLMLCGLVGSLPMVNAMLALSAIPPPVGLNVTATVQLVLGAAEVPQEPPVTVKSPTFAPLKLSLMGSGNPDLFETVTSLVFD